MLLGALRFPSPSLRCGRGHASPQRCRVGRQEEPGGGGVTGVHGLHAQGGVHLHGAASFVPMGGCFHVLLQLRRSLAHAAL